MVVGPWRWSWVERRSAERKRSFHCQYFTCVHAGCLSYIDTVNFKWPCVSDPAATPLDSRGFKWHGIPPFRSSARWPCWAGWFCCSLHGVGRVLGWVPRWLVPGAIALVYTALMGAHFAASGGGYGSTGRGAPAVRFGPGAGGRVGALPGLRPADRRPCWPTAWTAPACRGCCRRRCCWPPSCLVRPAGCSACHRGRGPSRSRRAEP